MTGIASRAWLPCLALGPAAADRFLGPVAHAAVGRAKAAWRVAWCRVAVLDKSELEKLLVAAGLADKAQYTETIAHLARLTRPTLSELDAFIKENCS